MRNRLIAKRLLLCLVASGGIALGACGLSDRQWTSVWESVITTTLSASASAAIQAAFDSATVGSTP